MKVVLFCGGLGMRLREEGGNTPKPLVKIGYRPILWHIMKYYAHYGHTDFILCLGYQADAIKRFFVNYSEFESNDFVLSQGGKNLSLLNQDISDWRITFVDTGLNASIGERLAAVQEHVEGEEWFLANYTDGLTDLDLDEMIEFAKTRDTVATFLAVHPNVTFHTIDIGNDGTVLGFKAAGREGERINGGYFVMKSKIFEYLQPGEDLVAEPFERLIKDSQLAAYEFDGFWACMDTFKEKQLLEDIHHSERAPWQVWQRNAGTAS